MLRNPTEFELQQLAHVYDPVKSREYYLRNRKLKGRKKGVARATIGRQPSASDPRTGKSKAEIAKNAKARQRKELATQVKNLEQKLKKLDDLIATKMREEASEDRKGKAKKERAAKDADKPKSAAEKAKAARENEKYRDKNKQKLKNEAKKSDGKSGGDSKKKGAAGKASVSDLKAIKTRIKGQLAVAKQKLAAL